MRNILSFLQKNIKETPPLVISALLAEITSVGVTMKKEVGEQLPYLAIDFL
ncbi:MAG: hypothetical protein V1698_00950 [bacterium]